jgi:two-component system response regulator HydG
MALDPELYKKWKRNEPIVGIAVGSGQLACNAVENGADLLFALNAGIYRNMGIGSLAAFMPYANANDQTVELIRNHFLPTSLQVPVVAGVMGTDEVEPVKERLEKLKTIGINGIINWPAAGFIDGNLGRFLEITGINAEKELEMLKTAGKMGFSTFGFVVNSDQAREFAASGIDALVINLGLTRKMEEIPEKRDQLQLDFLNLNRMLDAARKSGKKPLCLSWGGVITDPEDLEELLRYCKLDGFAGGSVFERLPISETMSSTIHQFKSVMLKPSREGMKTGMGKFLGKSLPMKRIFSLIKKIAPHNVNVCIEGESGTGKELVATQLHQMSNRAHSPFVTLNCGAIPDTLLESELFGHEKGAFTGANRQRLGKFELAQGGTLFLDEIADLSPHGQVALLRSIQQREITRVGGDNPIPVDVRILAASNQGLARLVEEEKFRADLYYRLNNITITIPPLRERLEDLSILVDEFLARMELQLNRKFSGISPRFLDKLKKHNWPGNVRELQHVIGQAALLEDGPILEGKQFMPAPQLLQQDGLLPDAASTRKSRHEAALSALSKCGGNKSRAAEALGITRRTLYAWLGKGE